MYEFGSIPLGKKPRHLLELLNHLGLVRPVMLRRLLDLRNALEHEDVPAPDKSECELLVEFVWYFLRSTDRLVRVPVNSIGCSPNFEELDRSRYSLNFDFNEGTIWRLRAFGWLRACWVSATPVRDWAEFTVDRSATRAQHLELLAKDEGEDRDFWGGCHLQLDDLHLSGELFGPEELILVFIRRYFDTY
jgi:hypothetical protein